MATLKEHQAAMVDLLANGSGIPASASRLAHAMHDVLNLLLADTVSGRREIASSLFRADATTPGLNDKAHAMHDVLSAVLLNAPLSPVDSQGRAQETTPGLNDKALSKPKKALKTDSPAKGPTPAEQRVKELENTIRQLKANNAKLKQERDELIRIRDYVCTHESYEELNPGHYRCCDCGEHLSREDLPEQAGCRKDDTQFEDLPDCWHKWVLTPLGDYEVCSKCGLSPIDVFGPTKKSSEQAGCRKPDTQVCGHEFKVTDGTCWLCGVAYVDAAHQDKHK